MKKYSKEQIELIKTEPIKYGNMVDIVDLVSFLKTANSSYYKDSEPIIEDKIYDILMFILKERDPTNELLNKIGIFDLNSDNNEVQLPYPMASLEKITELNDIKKNITLWTKKYIGPYVISDKLDGVSAQLTKHMNGIVKLYTRGDGTIGQDISHLIKHLTTKTQLDNLELGMSLRGEIVMPKASLNKLEQKYANGRSSISGLVGAKQTNYNKDTAKYSKLVIYGIINPPDLTQTQMMEKIEEMGFECVWYKIIKSNKDPIEFEKLLRKNLNNRKDASLYDIDGIVCVDSSKIYKINDKNPKHAFAFKIMFKDQIAETIVKDIIWEPSMYYYLNPTIVFDQIILKGSKITRATAHNAKYIKDNKIGIGTKIKIIKSGDVIPYILSIVKPSKKAYMPTIKYKWTKSKVDIIAINPSEEVLKNVIIRRNEHFFKTLKVKYFSKSTISKLYDNGYTDVFKILNAKTNKEKLTKIDGLGIKSVDKIFDGIEKNIKTSKLHILMYASLEFGRNFGKSRIKKIIDKYPKILTMEYKKDELVEKIKNINGFSDITSEQFVEHLEKFKEYYSKLEKYVDLSHINKSNKSNKKIKIVTNLEGEKIVFTGFRDDLLQETIIENGGDISTSVSKNTTIVIYEHDETKPKPAKLLKALQLYKENNKPLLFKKNEFIEKYNIKN
jgi:NAD-dependent DNA ligase